MIFTVQYVVLYEMRHDSCVRRYPSQSMLWLQYCGLSNNYSTADYNLLYDAVCTWQQIPNAQYSTATMILTRLANLLGLFLLVADLLGVTPQRSSLFFCLLVKEIRREK